MISVFPCASRFAVTARQTASKTSSALHPDFLADSLMYSSDKFRINIDNTCTRSRTPAFSDLFVMSTFPFNRAKHTSGWLSLITFTYSLLDSKNASTSRILGIIAIVCADKPFPIADTFASLCFSLVNSYSLPPCLLNSWFSETLKIACLSLLIQIIPRSILEVSLLFENFLSNNLLPLHCHTYYHKKDRITSFRSSCLFHLIDLLIISLKLVAKP